MELDVITVSTFCSGIGAGEQALKELGIEHEVVFSAEIDKYARQTYLANHKTNRMIEDMTTPDYIGEEWYSDLNIAGLPCQSFSLAGKRLGENDPRGILFFDFYRYVKNQMPKFFILENVKGLLSMDNGTVFQNWKYLLGRSVNTHINMFNHPDSLEYNLHYKVLNTKDFGLPQNRERVFLVGIRKDLPNTFRFPIGEPLKLRLKDVLESEVDEKYYLSDKAIKGFIRHTENMREKGNGFKFEPSDGNIIASTITTRAGGRADDNYIKVKEATQKGYALAKEGDSINFSQPNSKTRRGRVGYGIANTLDTACNQAVIEPVCVVMRGRNPDNPSSRKAGDNFEQTLEINSQCTTNCLSTVQKDNLILEGGYRIRKLTELECFRLQGFDDSFAKPCSMSQTYRQAGNTISVPVIKAILSNLLT